MSNWWKGYPWRVIQTNMREIDMADLDAQRFVEDLKSFHANAVMLNAAGVLASYPTALEDHAQNEHLTGDSLAALVTLCHENGIKVIARTDFSKIRKEIFLRHPEWAYRSQKGEPLHTNDNYHACISAGFQGEYMDKILKEMLTSIPFDGVYCNMGGFMNFDYNGKLHGPCHCESCRKTFRERYGYDLPEKDLPYANPADPTVMAYQKFKNEITQQQKARIAELLHSINPDIAYCSVDYLRAESNAEFGRGLPHWQYSASSNTRVLCSTGKESTNADVDFLGFSMRHVSVTPVLQELRLWQTLANFGGIDYFIMGRLDNKQDTSAYARVKKVFAFAEQHENMLYGANSVAEILLLRDMEKIARPEERGWIRALTELHIPFDEAVATQLKMMKLQKYKIIILPEKARIGASESLNAFVQGGGIVIASGRPPMAGKSPLVCLGLEVAESPMNNMLGAMLKVPEGERGLIPIGRNYYPTVSSEAVKPYLPLLLPERFGPPELCYPTEPATSHHGLLVHPYGEGLGITIPWNPGTCYHDEGYDIWLWFMQGVLERLCHVTRLSQTLSPMVEVTHGCKDDTEVLHFVNGTGHFGTSFFEPVTLIDQSVDIPWDKALPQAESLFAKNNVLLEQHENKLRITIKQLGFYECITLKK